METNQIPEPRINPPNLDNLSEYIKANQNHIQLDASYNHLPQEQALEQMGKQAQKVVNYFRKMGKSDDEIKSIVADYLLGSNHMNSTSERK